MSCPTPAITYADLVARAETCLAIAAERAAVADYGRAAKFTHYAESLVDVLEIDRRARGESWDVGGRETLEDRLRRVKDVLPGVVIEEDEAERVSDGIRKQSKETTDEQPRPEEAPEPAKRRAVVGARSRRI